MIRLDQPLPDPRERPLPGDYNFARAPRGGACIPREVQTVDPRELAAYMAAWDNLDDESIAAGAEMSSDPVAYMARVLAARGGR